MNHIIIKELFNCLLKAKKNCYGQHHLVQTLQIDLSKMMTAQILEVSECGVKS